jgi:UPF0271 protein
MPHRLFLGVDLNADVGEGAPHDADLIPLLASANISCGAHAGDPQTIVAALRLCKQHNVRAGAHPGYFDREHFGRRELQLPTETLYFDLVYQVVGFLTLAHIVGVRVEYLKPHGALYHQACREPLLAQTVVRVAERSGLAVMGLPDSELEKATKNAGKLFIREGFLDRRYRPDGSLVPRGEPGAFISDPAEAAAQARRLINEHQVVSLCVHGDGPDPVSLLRGLREKV